MNDIVVNSDPHDGSVTLGIMGSSRLKISPDAARATAHALLAAADEAERPCFSLYRDAHPPRPGTVVRIVDRHGHPVAGMHAHTVSRVESKAPRSTDEPFDKVWLADGTGPFVRQAGYNVYLLCDNGHHGGYRFYLALA